MSRFIFPAGTYYLIRDDKKRFEVELTSLEARIMYDLFTKLGFVEIGDATHKFPALSADDVAYAEQNKEIL